MEADRAGIFQQPISEWIWRRRYRRAEAGIGATWDRVAEALAGAESDHREAWAGRFRDALNDFRFLPGGRILANAGAGGSVLGNTLFNCFVMDAPTSDVHQMFEVLRESMLTLRAGGGIGCDFSAVPPAAHTRAQAHGSTGVVAAMKLWDAACAAVTDNSVRPGAMMAVLRDDHPDIEMFVDAKSDLAAAASLKHFNCSVLVSDDLMRAVERDEPWPLVFPMRGRSLGGREILRRRWSGNGEAEDCDVVRRIPARALWDRIMSAAFAAAEPGVIFIDRVRHSNNLAYCEQIDAANPCGEVPLPAYGACNLGSINLARFVRDAFGEHAHLDLPGIASTTVVATRMLDNVYEVSGFPLPSQATVARRSRRLGIGITGLADALAMLGLRYDAPEAVELARRVMALICHTAYRGSTVLARERGSFPAFERDAYCTSPFVASLPADIVEAIRKFGIRNSHLLAIAPAGSISLLADNVSSGMEPIFAPTATRWAVDDNGERRTWQVTDWAWAQFRRVRGAGAEPPDALIAASPIDPFAQLRMQAALQTYVDNAISKTIQVDPDTGVDAFRRLYIEAYRLGLKGCTVYRPNAITGTTLCRCHDP
jgi:ribonucleoside-diphosphate reductase alpha chain